MLWWFVAALILAPALWLWLRPVPRPAASSSGGPAARGAQLSLTPSELRKFDGRDGRPIYLAVRGTVYDVTPSRDFYGEGGSYALFAGRDCTRALAKNSLSDADLDAPSTEGLSLVDRDTLAGWEEQYRSKYAVVGTLVAPGGPKRD